MPVGASHAGILSGAAIPDSGLLHHYDAQNESGASTFTDLESSKNLAANGGPVLTASINSNQAMGYDGADDEHVDSSPMATGASDVYTLLAVIRWDTLDPGTGVCNGDEGTDGIGLRNLSNSMQFVNWGVAPHDLIAETTDPLIFVATHDGTDTIVDLNKTEELNVAESPNSPTTQVSFASDGGAGFSDVTVGEVGWYNQAKSASGRDELTDYAAGRWGISV